MKKILLTSLIAFASMLAYAQAVTTVPYAMSFEDQDAAELTNWVLNAGPQGSLCRDQWEVSNSIHSDGKKGLFITVDSLHTPSFGNEPNLQIAYRDFVFPAGKFVISFDWMNVGSDNALLYVGYVRFPIGTPTADANRLVANATSGAMIPRLANLTYGFNALHAQYTWKNETFPVITTDGSFVYRLYFAWANSETNPSIKMGACIDNIQINDAFCVAPTNIRVSNTSCDSVYVEWEGMSDSYQLQYRKQGTTPWSTTSSSSLHPNYLYLESMAEGSYEFRVRGVCHDSVGSVSYSAYTYSDPFVVYCPELHCLSYFNLQDTNMITCSQGEYQMDTYTKVPTSYQEGLVDFGSWSDVSRHTVMWDPTETDPRTFGELSVVPQGNSSSVRLHTWNPTGRYYSAVDYKLHVDPDMSILILKYALVQEYASYHSPTDEQQARFFLQIQDSLGNLINTCGEKTMRAGYDSENWLWKGKAEGQPLQSEMVVWKDWTTMGVDMTPYVGRTVTIHLEASGCSESAHFGYAYFVLDCANATISATSCGAESSMSVEAPEGFSYEWFDNNGVSVSTDRHYEINSTDSTTYTCRLTDTETSGCYFELKVASLPRFPMPDFSYKYDPQECQNRVVFTNKSYVETRYNGKVERAENGCDGYEWDFGDNNGVESQPNCVHIFPQTGGKFPVTLTTWLASGEGACTKDTTIIITLPNIHDTIVDIDKHICQGEMFKVNGKVVEKTGTYVEHIKTFSGCDSITNYNVTIHPTYQIRDSITLCYGDGKNYCLNGDCYGKEESDTWKRYLTTQWGCDSVVWIDVNVKDEILPLIDFQEIDEEHEYATIQVNPSLDGNYDYFTINGKRYDNTFRLDSLEDGFYTFTFYNDFGCALDQTIEVVPGCIRDVIYQRWNDVLSIKNADHRAARYQAYEFVGFQWYKNLLPIPGAVDSYYFEAGGLDPEAVYSCLLTLADGSQEMSCDYTPAPVAMPVSVSPTYVPGGEVVRVSVPEDATCELYSTTGLKMLSASLVAGDNYIQVPYQSGIYVLQIKMQDMALPFRLSIAQ